MQFMQELLEAQNTRVDESFESLTAEFKCLVTLVPNVTLTRLVPSL